MVIIHRKEYNILLLGQTGAGPEQDDNECQTIGQSGTKCIQSYIFEFENIAVRLIDTPGFGDTSGKEQDEKTCENLISFLSNRNDVQELHSIVFIAKPQENRFTVFFEYCINQIFSKLHKDAAQNVIFVFTHAKGTQYKPGPTRLLLEKAVDKMSNKIPVTKENIFCVENDCIQYLFTSFFGGLTLNSEDMECYLSPWKRSSEGYVRLIKYVKTLTPCSVQDIVRINEFRRHSIKLETLLEKILEKINDNMKECKQYSEFITTRILEGKTLENLQVDSTYITREGKYCVTCYNKECPKRNGADKTVCCPNCSAWTLSWCEQMSFINSNCKYCGCSDFDHTFSKNKDNPQIKHETNVEIVSILDQKRQDINEARIKQLELQLNQKKYIAEKEYIKQWILKLRKCLNETSFLPEQPTNPGEVIPENVNENNTKEIFSLEELLQELDPKHFDMMGKDLQQVLEKIDMHVPNDKVYHATPVLDKWKEIDG
ncbi:hypothetical protein QE152_g200 [Popillia japonica]|uniref:AIG1-type G domain-containing protein n=1 Tax=Popillia japonica TaxID=7064 RepID=A0AAW1NBQ8_POPJA